MNALARADIMVDEQVAGETSGWSAAGLSSLLAANADRHPHRLAFIDQPDREDWSGRPRIAWTYANTHHIVDRLATFLSGLGLPAGAPVGICLPNSSEACVALLAVERAGYIPCLLPLAWPDHDLSQAIEAANVSAVICQVRVGDQRPADLFCSLAARHFGLRFICAFGPHVPDGVIDLDRAILDTVPKQLPTARTAHEGIVTFKPIERSFLPVFRPYPSAIAAAMAFLVSERIEASDRILSLLPPDDHRGLTTGFVASLVTGATLEMQGLFDKTTFVASIASDSRIHLVAPGWMEPALARAGTSESVASVVLVHEAPVRFKARGELHHSVTDVLGFGEVALVARSRPPSGHLNFALDEDAEHSAGDLLRLRRDENGMIHFAGSATEVYEFRKGLPLVSAQAPVWRSSGFKADLFAGIVIGIR
jgi:mycobactin salicyl-AMP ligase